METDNSEIQDKYGDWIVIQKIFIRTKKRKLVPCRCICGTEQNISYYNLKNQKTTKCKKCISQSRRITSKDIQNQYGKWSVIDKTLINGTVLCKCECGIERRVNHRTLRRGHSNSCGSGQCAHYTPIDNNYYNWKVIDKNISDDGKILCECICGNVAMVRLSNLRTGHSKQCRSCGNTIHGEVGSRLYSVWQNMVRRCHDRNSKSYADYGMIGIAVCDEWRNSYSSFRDWAISKEYREDLYLDRIKTDQGYCPDNCRWATPAQSSYNRMGDKHSSSLYKGVSFHKKTNKWYSRITIKRKDYNIGLFDNEIDAAKAYDLKAKEIFGEFAWLNFPEIENGN